MPTYEYRCSLCRHEWEIEQRIKEAPLDTCPKCAERTAVRQVSKGVGFLLKGGGWASDGYGKKSIDGS